MRRWREISLICFLLFTFVTAMGITALQSQNREPRQKKVEFPVVDYNTSEPTDPQERAKRKKKGEKYNNAIVPINPAREMVNQNEVVHFPTGTPSLPVSQSAAVIIGTVTKAQAHLSSDKSYVYSEFDVLVSEVIKDDGKSPFVPGKTVAVERPGGRVRVPSGHIHEYTTTLNPLSVGSCYALFLTRRGDDYHVFTGYKLEEGQVFPIDYFFKRYEGASEEEFMRDLRQAIIPSAETQRSSMNDSQEVNLAVDPEPPDPGGDCQLPAPPPCITPPTDQRPRFTPGTVTVTYNPDHFSPEYVQALRNGYMAWNNLGNVRFTEPTPSRERPALSSNNTLHFESQVQPTDMSGGQLMRGRILVEALA